MSEVPDDLMKVAEETLDLMLCECAESCGGTDGLRRESIATLARALAAERERATLAERERCAKVIDCGCERDHCPFPGNCSKDDIDDIMRRP